MQLPNLRVKVKEITQSLLVLETEQGEKIEFPRHLLPNVASGDELFLSADYRPLISSEKHAKDVLNEIIKE